MRPVLDLHGDDVGLLGPILTFKLLRFVLTGLNLNSTPLRFVNSQPVAY